MSWETLKGKSGTRNMAYITRNGNIAKQGNDVLERVDVRLLVTKL